MMEYLTLQEVATMLKISLRQARRLAADGKSVGTGVRYVLAAHGRNAKARGVWNGGGDVLSVRVRARGIDFLSGLWAACVLTEEADSPGSALSSFTFASAT